MTRFLLLCCIYFHSITHGVDPRIVAAQVFCESSFRPGVVNKGCYGLMQINYKVWRKPLNLDFQQMLKVNYNLDKGCWILAHYLKVAKGDYRRALKLYNSGFRLRDTGYAERVMGVAGFKVVEYGR